MTTWSSSSWNSCWSTTTTIWKSKSRATWGMIKSSLSSTKSCSPYWIRCCTPIIPSNSSNSFSKSSSGPRTVPTLANIRTPSISNSPPVRTLKTLATRPGQSFRKSSRPQFDSNSTRQKILNQGQWPTPTLPTPLNYLWPRTCSLQDTNCQFWLPKTWPPRNWNLNQ